MIVITALLFIILDITMPVNTRIEYGQLVRAEDGTILHAYLTHDEQWRMKANLDEITPELKKAIIYKEDKYFYYHPGVNVFAVGRAAVNNLLKQKRTSGASTITMQVARMLEPKKRSYFNKIAEMFRALQLELHYTKEEILQLYLNLVPYGSNIQGVKAAAILYFNKTPGQLSLAEITALSVIPNRPNSLAPGEHNSAIVKARNKWLQRFKQDNVFNDAAIQDALEEPLNAYRHDAPRRAPQFAYRMLMQYPAMPEVFTTIDARMQTEAEAVVSNYMTNLKLNNINNASVFIIDNKTHQVKTYIGSPDFFDAEHNGQVDGITSARSPGSTLKPLLYGLCIDHGIITPKTIIADVPVNYEGYAPENYDLGFRGNIAAEDALRMSLNIPAVKLLNALGTPHFISSLSRGGVSTIWNDRNRLGLSMILGGCVIRLDELSNIYSSFANGGLYHPVRWLRSDTVYHNAKDRMQVLSPAAAYMVTNILTELHRPDVPNLAASATGIPKIAWKTGTSYGRKDAWSIGYNANYTIGVWVGNFDGTGVPELNGAGTASPLLFRIFNTVDRNVADDWLKAPEELEIRFVCKESGKVPNDYCSEQVADYFIPGISPNQQCDHQKEVWLSADETFSYCTTCRPVNGYKTKVFPNISAELTAYYEQNHIPYTQQPPHNPKCTRLFDGDPPGIISLTDNATYLIVDKQQQKLQLQCTAANDVKKVYWYINNKFFASTGVGESAFFIPADRNIKISCADDKGRNTDIRIKVKFI